MIVKLKLLHMEEFDIVAPAMFNEAETVAFRRWRRRRRCAAHINHGRMCSLRGSYKLCLSVCPSHHLNL